MCYCLVFCVSASGAGEAGGRRGEENAWTKIHKTQFAVYVSDKPKQGYDNAKFEKPHLNSVCERANKTFLSKQETHQLPPLNMRLNTDDYMDSHFSCETKLS